MQMTGASPGGACQLPAALENTTSSSARTACAGLGDFSGGRLPALEDEPPDRPNE
jgi:hypothetical protein